MTSLIADIVRYSLRLSPALIAFGILIALLGRWGDSDSSAGSSIAATGVSYIAHRMVLYNLRFSRWGKMEAPEGAYVPPEAVGRFIVVSLGHLAIGLVVVFFVASLFSGVMAHHGAAFWIILFSMSMVSWVLLTFLGTIYPASADHEFPSLIRALRAGRQTWSSVAWQLLLFPGLYGFVVIAVSLMAIPSAGEAERWDPVFIALDALSLAAQFEIQVMIAVILTRAYRRAWE